MTTYNRMNTSYNHLTEFDVAGTSLNGKRPEDLKVPWDTHSHWGVFVTIHVSWGVNSNLLLNLHGVFYIHLLSNKLYIILY